MRKILIVFLVAFSLNAFGQTDSLTNNQDTFYRHAQLAEQKKIRKTRKPKEANTLEVVAALFLFTLFCNLNGIFKR